MAEIFFKIVAFKCRYFYNRKRTRILFLNVKIRFFNVSLISAAHFFRLAGDETSAMLAKNSRFGFLATKNFVFSGKKATKLIYLSLNPDKCTAFTFTAISPEIISWEGVVLSSLKSCLELSKN